MTYAWNPDEVQQANFGALFDIRKGDQGDIPAALQLNLPACIVDGNFGSKTEQAVMDWQVVKDLQPVDGIAGALTQASIVTTLTRPSERAEGLPKGILEAIAVHESNNALAALSLHPSDDGIDLGAFQFSIGGNHGLAPIQTNYQEAYDVEVCAKKVAEKIRNLQATFKTAPAVDTETPSWYAVHLKPKSRYRAWIWAYQLALFSHNWPAAAANLGSLGRVYKDPVRDDQEEQWIITATDGRLRTPRQWTVAYIEDITNRVTWRS